MASLHRSYTLNARALSTTPAAGHRLRYFTSSARCSADAETRDKPAAPPKAGFRTTIRNQTAFNAIRNAQGGSNNEARPRPVGSPRGSFNPRQGQNGRPARAQPSRGSIVQNIGRTPRAPPGTAPGGNRPARARFPGKPTATGARRPGGPPGKGRRQAPRKSEDDDKKPKRTEISDPDFMSGQFGPGDVHFASEGERQYVCRKFAKMAAGEPFNPNLDDLVPARLGPANLTTASGSANILHQLLAQGNPIRNRTDGLHPEEIARRLLAGDAAFMRSDKEAAQVQEYAKLMTEKRAARLSEEQGKEVKPTDTTLKGADAQTRAAVEDTWLAGKYTPLVQQAAGSDVLRDVLRQIGRNETFSAQTQQGFVKKIASLMPTRPPPQQARKAAAAGGKQSGKAPAKAAAKA